MPGMVKAPFLRYPSSSLYSFSRETFPGCISRSVMDRITFFKVIGDFMGTDITFIQYFGNSSSINICQRGMPIFFAMLLSMLSQKSIGP